MKTLNELYGFCNELIKYREQVASGSTDDKIIQSLRTDLQRTYSRLEDKIAKYSNENPTFYDGWGMPNVFESAFGSIDLLNHSAKLSYLDRCIKITNKAIGKLQAERDSWEVSKQTPRSTSGKPKASISRSRTKDTVSNGTTSGEAFAWDAFISHATEDKEPFVRKLAQSLVREKCKVWYDEYTLRVGDSLRRSIDKGLAKSRYGIVVLSPNFFVKEYPQTELDGLAARQRSGQKVILPVWLEVDQSYVAQHSPTLADLVAAKASEGMDKVVAELLHVLKP